MATAGEKMPDYVQFYTTRIDPMQSQGDIMSTLHRYGASGFGFHRRGSVVEVTFHLPEDGGERSVRIPVDVDRVHDRLVGQLASKARKEKQAVNTETMRAQAERVAWRVLLSWINAALSAVAIGAQTIEEAFFAHVVVETTDGQNGRLIDYVHTLEGGDGATPGRLPNPGAVIDGSFRRALGPGK
jgi:hypothetical protein